MERIGGGAWAQVSDTLPRIDVGDVDGPWGAVEAPELLRVGVLGQGGMGVVFRATQRSLDRDVAIKQLHPNAKKALATPLIREARILGRLEHPNIVPVHRLGLGDDGLPLVVMKRIEGILWERLLRDPEPAIWRDDPEASGDVVYGHVQVLLQVCHAIGFAHSRGVIHLDLKPSNVMIGAFGEVYVLDWGIATAGPEDLAGRRPCGTPSYMAPEMVSPALPLTPATDVYLLGALLHEVLTGKPPHTGATVEIAMWQAFESKPIDYGPGIDAALGAIARRAMSAAPEERFPSALAFEQALREWIRDRATRRIVEAAGRRLETLRELIADGGEQHGQVDAAFFEARFGFRQALQSHAGSIEASLGLQEALEAMAGQAIGRRELVSARSLIGELAELAPERAEALMDHWSQAKADQVRMEAKALRVDTGVGGRARALAVIIGPVVVLAVMVASALAGVVSERNLTWLIGTVNCLITFAAWAATRHKAEGLNRSFLGYQAWAGLIGIAVLGLVEGLGAPLAACHAAVMVATAGHIGTGAIYVQPSVMPMAVTFLLGAVAAMLMPAWSFYILLAVWGLAVVIAARVEALSKGEEG